MRPNTYRDMHLLEEVTRTPDLTQRELSKRIGIALGLTNLMLRRLATKGFIKISGTKRSRVRYLITPQGILEKSRLTYEFVHYSFQLYRRLRDFLQEQLSLAAAAGHRRILLCGTNEVAEIAFLTIHEMGLELVGVVDESYDRQDFLGQPVQGIDLVKTATFDRMVIASLQWTDGWAQRLAQCGVSEDRIIVVPQSGLPRLMPTQAGASLTAPEVPDPVQAAPAV